MVDNTSNLNYILGFGIAVLVILFIMVLRQPGNHARHNFDIGGAPLGVGITVITIRGPINLTHVRLSQYLINLTNSIESLVQKIDIDRCADIASRISESKVKFSSIISEAIESQNLTPDQINALSDERVQYMSRINALTQALFDNDQNEDQLKSVESVHEILQDLNTLLFLVNLNRGRSEPLSPINLIDVDRVIQLIYESACSGGARSEPGEPIDPAKDDSVGVNAAGVNSSSGAFVDRCKQQLKAETDVFTSTPRKFRANIKNTRKKTLESSTQVRKEPHGSSRVHQTVPQYAASSARHVMETFASGRSDLARSLGDFYRDPD